jgi:hypothetical protein
LAHNTSSEYDAIVKVCKELFIKKTRDYGTAWRILRPSSITDQIFIKAQRIRTIEDKKINKVGDDIIGEYIGIINYCIIAIMQLELDSNAPQELNRVSSLTDLILMKILRVKQIEDNDGKTLASEGVKANYQDMVNYAIFALIKLGVA